MTEHIVYSSEAQYGTWVTPARTLPVDECNIQSQREQVPLDVTGFGRGRYLSVPGAKPVNGPLNLPWWMTRVGAFFGSFLVNAVQTVVDTGVYNYGLLPDDDLPLNGFSIQQRYSPTVAINVLSAYVASMSIALAIKEAARVQMTMEAKDDAVAGANWDYNGQPSPAVIDPLPAYAALMRPMMFYDVALTLGATVGAGTGNRFTVAGGTTYNLIETLNLNIDNGVDTEGYGLTPDPTRQVIYPGARTIGADLELDWSSMPTVFSNAWRNDVPMTLRIDLVGPVITGAYRYEAHITIPRFRLSSAQHPAASGDKSRRKQSASGEAEVDQTLGTDINVWIQTSEATL